MSKFFEHKGVGVNLNKVICWEVKSVKNSKGDPGAGLLYSEDELAIKTTVVTLIERNQHGEAMVVAFEGDVSTALFEASKD